MDLKSMDIKNPDLFDFVQIDILKHILPVKKSTLLFILYGRLPTELTVCRRMVC